MHINLKGRTALITGAGSGIGRGCALALAECGAAVLVNDRDESAAQQTVDQIVAAKGSAKPLRADISSEADVQAMFDHAKTFTHGKLDILVNNAGFNLFKGLADTTPAEWDQVMAVDLRGLYLVTHTALPLLKASGHASIINIASVHARLTVPNMSAYPAAKGGIVSLTRALCQELGPAGIRVNAVSPGFIDTPLIAQWLASEPDPPASLKRINGYHPVGRIGKPQDIGALVAFLASDLSSFITGQDLVVDGGLTARLMH
jgi:NAD(P)-dependent dehydrogenase (short-subunit alcohol dehydrogenase family)